jgi:GDP-4-dehydro-6-deoxy-D-mannose reductase
MTNSVLITGVHGFCAGHLIKRLIAEGVYNIYGVDIHPSPPEGFNLKGYSKVDITDRFQMNQVVRDTNPDRIYHLAGITQGEASEIYHVNFLGSIHLLEAALRWAPQAKVLLVGSAAEYGHVPEEEMPIYETRTCNPYTPYGISKYASTLAGLEYAKRGLDVTIARPFNIIGPGVPETLVAGAVVARIRCSMRDNSDEVRIGNLKSRRDFIYVGDVVEAYIRMLDGEYRGEIFNICSSKAIEIQELADGLMAQSRRPLRLVVDPSLVRTNEVDSVYGSFDKAAKNFGFQPATSIDKALSTIWQSDIEGCL